MFKQITQTTCFDSVFQKTCHLIYIGILCKMFQRMFQRLLQTTFHKIFQKYLYQKRFPCIGITSTNIYFMTVLSLTKFFERIRSGILCRGSVFQVLHSRNLLRSGTLVGTFKIDVKTVYDAPGRQDLVSCRYFYFII